MGYTCSLSVESSVLLCQVRKRGLRAITKYRLPVTTVAIYVVQCMEEDYNCTNVADSWAQIEVTVKPARKDVISYHSPIQ